MGGYNIGYWGVRHEAAWGTSLVINAASTAYWLGLIPANAGAHPWSTKTYRRGVPSPLNEYSTTIYRNTLTPRVTVTAGLLDAVPLWFAFGESANGGGPAYTHSLTFRDGSGAAMPDPPSFTWHRELIGTGLTDDRMQTTGLRVETCRVVASKDRFGGVMAVILGLVGKQHDDTITFSLTNKPASRISGARVFNFTDLTTKTLGGDDIVGLRGVELFWTRPILPEHQFRAPGGTNESHLVYDQHFGDLQGPFLRLTVEPEDFEEIGYHDIDATTPAKDLSLVFTRGTNDTITFTGTNWHPSIPRDLIRHPTSIPPVVLEGPLEQLTCAVVDSLDGAVHYA